MNTALITAIFTVVADLLKIAEQICTQHAGQSAVDHSSKVVEALDKAKSEVQNASKPDKPADGADKEEAAESEDNQ